MTESTQPQTVQVQMLRRGSSLGVASLVLGTISFAICWVPLLGMLGLPLSGLGFVLGLIGILVALVRKGSSIGYPIAGTLNLWCVRGDDGHHDDRDRRRPRSRHPICQTIPPPA